MNARYALVSPISPPISDIRYEKPPSGMIPISDIENLDVQGILTQYARAHELSKMMS